MRNKIGFSSTPTVAVLMSTYNGEKYVEEQIQSILNQKGVLVNLYIRDDGSTDNTINIIQKYTDISNIYIIIGSENLKPALSFMQLLYITEGYDFYAFADQDDIWLPDKLSKAVNQLITIQGPGLYGSNQILYINESECGLRYTSEVDLSLVSELFGNHISGCTMVINSALANILREKSSRPDNQILSLRMHDTWVMTSALLNGTVIYDHNSYILYRVHENNSVGLKGDNVTLIERAEMIFKAIINRKEVSYRSKYAKELLRCYPNIDKEDQYILRLLSDYKTDFKVKMELLRNRTIREKSGEAYFGLIVKVLLNSL